jgi:hypothetical protein
MQYLKFSLVASIFCFCALHTYAQTTNTEITAPSAKNVYAEIGGPGIFSFNYDQRFKGQKGLGFRAGIGGIGFLGAGVFAVPVGLNYLSGSNGHYFEMGAGASALTISDGESIFSNNSSTVIGFINFGYRYQPEKKGFTGRVFISPIFSAEGFMPIYGGISAGFKF